MHQRRVTSSEATMAKRKPDLEETLAWTIYQEMLSYIKIEQVIPNEHAFYEYVLIAEKGYQITLGAYRYHFGQLEKAGLIRVHPRTRAVKVLEKAILDRKDVPYQLLLDLLPQD
jgi:hypothetical protein